MEALASEPGQLQGFQVWPAGSGMWSLWSPWTETAWGGSKLRKVDLIKPTAKAVLGLGRGE